jgi:outer membrane protein TolC
MIARWFHLSGGVLMAALIISLSGCTTKYYREQADTAVYDILAYKRKAALKDENPFTIEKSKWTPLEGLPRHHQPIVPEELSDTSHQPKNAPVIINVSKALEIAVRNSRDYQSRKEDVYLTALNLTFERDAFTPHFSSAFSNSYTKTPSTETWGGDGTFGISQLLTTGAKVSLDITNDFLVNLTGPSDKSAITTIAGSIVQPLWRDAGRDVAEESLTQAERDVVYELRSFARFHKSFAVAIITEYYAILRQRAQVRNEWNNYKDLVRGRERSLSLAEAGRLKELEVDQAQQDELTARDRYIRTQQRYRDLLDRFKLTLSLPTDTNIDVDEQDLDRLRKAGIIHPDIASDKAVANALKTRLDLMNARDQIYDAKRKIKVAANGLGGDIDLVLTGSVDSTGDSKPASFNRKNGTYTAGLDIDLPLHRTAERNTYRRSLINSDRAERRSGELTDEVKQEVRQAWRALQEAKISYDINTRSLMLAKKRVESTTELRQAGRASTRDLLESQSSLLQAQNTIITVLVDHAIAKLDLWRDVGTLRVGPEGQMKGLLP